MRRFATLALTLASLASPLAAQSHPDFSGKWTLDTKASEGPMLPVAMEYVRAGILIASVGDKTVGIR